MHPLTVALKKAIKKGSVKTADKALGVLGTSHTVPVPPDLLTRLTVAVMYLGTESGSSEKAAQSEEEVLNRLKKDTDKIKVRLRCPDPYHQDKWSPCYLPVLQKVEKKAAKNSKLAKAVEEERKKHPNLVPTAKQVFYPSRTPPPDIVL